MNPIVQITHRHTGKVLAEGPTVKEALLTAIRTDADLSDADLRGADLSGADLRDADLRDADLSGADLRDADLRDADLRDAYLSGAYLSDADLRDADLRDADLRDADLSDAYLRDADLRDADLSGAYLSGADLSDADLSGAYLSGAYLRDAYLSGADLSGAKGLSLPIPADPTEPYVRGATKDYAARAIKYRLRHPEVPVVTDLDRKLLTVIESGAGQLEMGSWHSSSCSTTHCRAGWAITLAGDAGKALESEHGPHKAGRLIYQVSTGRAPHFFASNELALEDIRECADAREVAP